MGRDRRRATWIAIAAVAALGAAGAAIAGAADGGDEGTERAITGSDLTRASDSALRHTGGGRVTGTEVGDEEGIYEVEVTRPNGSETDVHLDRSFEVLGSEDEAAGEDERAGDD